MRTPYILCVLSAAILLTTPVSALAQSNLVADHAPESALSTLNQLASLNNANRLQSPEARALVSGEFAQIRLPTLGPLQLPDASKTLSDGTAVVRIPAMEGLPKDVYFYLNPTQGDRWTVDAVRVLALPGFIDMLYAQLRAKPDRTEKDDVSLRQLERLLSSDASHRTWFAQNKPALSELAGKAQRATSPSNVSAERVETPEVKSILDQLGASMMQITHNNVVLITMGGILDNSYGFLLTPEGIPAPPISNREYIWIEPLEDGWYLFKTT